MLPPRLTRELTELTHTYEVVDDGGFINLVLRSFELPPGYSMESADVLIRVPKSYPDAGPDMFWTDPDLRLRSGALPKNAEPIETYGGRNWRRFSWHHHRWNPSADNLHNYCEFIRERLRRQE